MSHRWSYADNQELPSNIILRKVGARYWLSFIVLGFGAVMTGMAFVKQWWQLAICRVLLGLLESKSCQTRCWIRADISRWLLPRLCLPRFFLVHPI